MESATYPTIQHSSGINVFLPLPTSACCVWWDSRRGKPVLLERPRHDWVCCFQLHGYLYLVKASEDAKRSKQAVKGSAVRNTSKVQWCSMSSSFLCKRLRDSVELKLVEACNILRHHDTSTAAKTESTCDCWRFNRNIHGLLLSPGLRKIWALENIGKYRMLLKQCWNWLYMEMHGNALKCREIPKCHGFSQSFWSVWHMSCLPTARPTTLV